MYKNRGFYILIILMASAVVITGCSDSDANGKEKGNGSENTNEVEPVVDENEEHELADFSINEPVTLKMINWWGEELWEKWWKDPVEDKFPNVTLEQIPIQPEKEDLEDIYAEGNIPDLFMGHFYHIRNLIEYETAYDMRDLIAKFGFDTDDFVPGLMEQIERESNSNEIYMLPFFVDRYALHYNKEIFDAFGVDYPTDNMTYSEVAELARDVTGEINDVQYFGLQWQNNSFDTVTAHLDTVNENMEPLFTSDDRWHDFFNLVERVYDIPGNKPSEEEFLEYVWSRFEGEQNVAMVPLWYNPGLVGVDSLNWDIVTYPTWEGFDGQVPGGVGFGMGVTETSENKEAAFAVLQYLVSKELVLERFEDDNHNFNHLVYNPDELGITSFDEGLKEYNMDSLFKLDFLTSKRQDPVLSETVIAEMSEFLYSNKDVNTHLRELSEIAEIYIEEQEIIN